jgi:hypothetical protein
LVLIILFPVSVYGSGSALIPLPFGFGWAVQDCRAWVMGNAFQQKESAARVGIVTLLNSSLRVNDLCGVKVFAAPA